MAKPVELKFKAVIDQESIDKITQAFADMAEIMQATADKMTEAMQKYVESTRV